VKTTQQSPLTLEPTQSSQLDISLFREREEKRVTREHNPKALHLEKIILDWRERLSSYYQRTDPVGPPLTMNLIC